MVSSAHSTTPCRTAGGCCSWTVSSGNGESNLHRSPPLDRLAYIGTRAMGALTYHPPPPVEEEPLGVDLAVVARQAERIVEGSPEEVLAGRLLRTTRGP